MLFERILNAAYNLFLSRREQIVRRNDVGVMRAPIPDSNPAVFLDDPLEGDWRPHGSMKDRLPLVGRSPLRTRDEITPAYFRRIIAAAGLCQPVNEGDLLVLGNTIHSGAHLALHL